MIRGSGSSWYWIARRIQFSACSLGFVLTTFCFVAFLVKCIFPQAWLRTVVTAVFSTAGAQIIFVNLLELQFPKDCLGSDGENCINT